jgi:large subunit ribosomal protein L19
MDKYDPEGRRRALFEKSSPSCLPMGSVLDVELWEDYPANTTFQSFAGHMIAVRRCGIDTSFRLRSIVSRIGVEQHFKLFAPNIKTIRVVHRGALRGKEYKRAKLYFTRKPKTRNWLVNVDHVVRKAKNAEREAKLELEKQLEKMGKGKVRQGETPNKTK